MLTVDLDFETRSTLDLTRVGAWRYCASTETEVQCCTYTIDDGPVRLWRAGEPFPYDLAVAVAEGALFFAHNSEFDALVWNLILYARHGWPRLPWNRWRCTAAMSATMGLPRSLDGMATALRLPIGKDKFGQKHMRALAKPAGYDDELRPVWLQDDGRLGPYAVRDTEVLNAGRRRLMPLRPDEQQLFELTMRMNGRGISVDVEAVRAAIPMVQAAQAELNAELATLTGGAVGSATQVARLQSWLADRLVVLPSLRRKVVELYRAQHQLDPVVNRALQIRLDAAKASVAKLNALVSRTDSDGRLRGALVFYGAATGRFSSTGVQLQNLPRPTMKHAQCVAAVETVRTGDRAAVERLYGRTLQVISDCLRSFFVAGPGRSFVVADFSKIEAVVAAWLAGQLDLLQAFRELRDVYCEQASNVYGRTITKADKVERQVGKVLALAAQYGLGARGFWVNCVLDGIPITFELAEDAISTYRAKNAAIVDCWYANERAAIEAVARPGTVVPCGRVAWLRKGAMLWCRLPSGRLLSYPYPSIKDVPDKHGRPRPRLHYEAINPATHQWGVISTYGSALFENIVQAIARDVMTAAMLQLDWLGLYLMLTVHDELVAEVPTEDAAAMLALMTEVMERPPAWALDLPVNVEGWIASRYGKSD